MKNMTWLIFGLLVLGCSEHADVEEWQEGEKTEMSDRIQTKATEYDPGYLIGNYIMTNGQQTLISFVGPSKIAFQASGPGRFIISAMNDEITIGSLDENSDGVLKKGIGNNVHWQLGVKYQGTSLGDRGTLWIYGYREKEAPPQSQNPIENDLLISWRNNLPSYINVVKMLPSCLIIHIAGNSEYSVLIYRKYKIAKEYNYWETLRLQAGGFHYTLDEEYAYWFGFYERIQNGDRVTFRYVGDLEVHPSFWTGEPYVY